MTMLHFIQSQLVLYASAALVLFVPGYFLLLATRQHKKFSPLEAFAIAFAASIILVDIMMMAMGKAGIIFTRFSILSGLGIFMFVCAAIHFFNVWRKKEAVRPTRPVLTKMQSVLFLAIMLLSIFVRSIYLQDTIAPTSTDLGHHTFWIKKIATTGKLPDYEKRDVVADSDGNYSISAPAKIDDFIIGEHLVFAAISLVSGADPLSPFPTVILMIINTMSLLAIFVLVFTLFGSFSGAAVSALVSLLLLGPLFAFSSSQANFVSGGVIGNLIGNLLIPLAFYFYYRALEEKDANMLAFGFFLTFGLLYTHHLSAFIFLFTLAAIVVGLVLADPKKALGDAKLLFKLCASPVCLTFIISAAIFFFFVMMPGYIQNMAVKTVIGAPSRSTKEGIPLSKLSELTGDARAALGLFGLAILFLLRSKYRKAFAVLFGWSAAVLLMSWKPGLVHINIPSIRIANYLVFPVTVLAAFAVAWIFSEFIKKDRHKLLIGKNWVISFFFVVFVFIASTGLRDNSDSLKDPSNGKPALLTFDAAKYMANHSDETDMILKDHNYIASDSWMKIFFMKDYNFPLTRSFFFRYEDAGRRENCTFDMISSPNETEAKKCFEQTGTDFIMVNPKTDSSQFEKTGDFWPVYSNGSISTYYRPKK